MTDLLLLPAGIAVGVINAVAGGGSLLSFPLFLLLGYSPFVANVSNSVGVFPSNLGGVVGYKDDLANNSKTTLRLACAVSLGTIGGAALLLNTGEAVFVKVVPWLIILGSLLMLIQPWLVRHIKSSEGQTHRKSSFAATAAVGVYGGYFGPGIGVMLMAVFGSLSTKSIHRANAYKNAAALCSNFICVVIFAIFAPVAWIAALAMGAGTFIGGFLGTKVAKRLPDKAFRAIVVLTGLAAAIGVAVTQ